MAQTLQRSFLTVSPFRDRLVGSSAPLDHSIHFQHQDGSSETQGVSIPLQDVALSPNYALSAVLFENGDLKLMNMNPSHDFKDPIFIDGFQIERVSDFVWISSSTQPSVTFLACITPQDIIITCFYQSKFRAVRSMAVQRARVSLNQTFEEFSSSGVEAAAPFAAPSASMSVLMLHLDIKEFQNHISLTHGIEIDAGLLTFPTCPTHRVATQDSSVCLMLGQSSAALLRLSYAPMSSISVCYDRFLHFGDIRASQAIAHLDWLIILDIETQNLHIVSLQTGLERLSLDFWSYWGVSSTERRVVKIAITQNWSKIILGAADAAVFYCVDLDDLMNRLGCSPASARTFLRASSSEKDTSISQPHINKNAAANKPSMNGNTCHWTEIHSITLANQVQSKVETSTRIPLDPRSTNSTQRLSLNSFNKVRPLNLSTNVGSRDSIDGSPAPASFTQEEPDKISSLSLSELSDASETPNGQLRKSSRDFLSSGPYDRPIIAAVVATPSRVISVVQSLSSAAPIFYSFDISNGADPQSVLAPSANITTIPDARLCGLYFVCSSALHFLLPTSISEDNLTNSIIIFENPSLADDLYARNGWDRRSLRLHTLKLGLRYRQIDVIQPALHSLDEDQQLAGCKLLLQFVRSNIRLILDELFWDELLQMAMNYVSEIIKNNARRQLTQEARQEMEKFSKILIKLRQHKAEVKTLTQGAAALTKEPSTSLFTSPFSVQKAKSRVSREMLADLQGQAERSGSLGAVRPLAVDLFGANNSSSASSSFSRLSPVPFDSLIGSSKTPSPDGQSMMGDGVEQTGSNTSSPHSAGQSSSSVPAAVNFIEPEKLDEMEDMQAAFLQYKDRWEKMQDYEILADALVTSNLSLAIGFLRWRALMFNSTAAASNLINFKRVREICHQLVYQVAMRGQLSLCRKMISGLGDTVDVHFALLARCTASRSVRGALLAAANRSSAAPQQLLQFAEELESFYPVGVYSHEFARRSMAASQQQAQLVESVPYHPEFECADLDDHIASADVDLHLDPSPTPPASLQSGAPGYAWFRLHWLSHILSKYPEIASRTTLESAILRSGGQSDSSISSFLKQNSAANLMAFVSFFAQHADIHRLELLLHLVAPQQKVNLDFVCERLKSLPPSFLDDFLDSINSKHQFYQSRELESPMALMPRLGRLNLLIPASQSAPLLIAESPEFEAACLQFSIDAKMPALLQAFLDARDLARSSESIQLLLAQSPSSNGAFIKADRTWVKLLLMMRHESQFFEAALLNAKMCLEAKRSVGVNSFLSSTATKEKRPIMALATLLYSPVSIREAMESSPDKPWFVERRQLIDLLGKYPTMKEAIFFSGQDVESDMLRKQYEADLMAQDTRIDIHSAHSDVSLVALLNENVAFGLDWIFGGQSNNILQSSGTVDLKAGESSELHHAPHTPSFLALSFEPIRFSDRVDIAFYLQRGEPLRAYQLLTSNRSEALKGFSMLSSSSEGVSRQMVSSKSQRNIPNTPSIESVGSGFSLSLQEMGFVSRTVRLVALRNFQDPAVLSACVSFLDMCDIDSLEVRVDVEALRIVAEHAKTAPDAAGLLKTFETSSPNQDDPILYQFLSLLEDTIQTVSEAKRLAPTSQEFIQLWRTVALFCHAHKLPITTTCLINLARDQDWIRLLHEAAVCNAPISSVLSVIAKNVPSVATRDHLLIAMRSLSKQKAQETGSAEATSLESGDQFDLLDPMDPLMVELGIQSQSAPDIFKLTMRALKRVYPGETLLDYSLQFKQPMLAAIASNYPDVPFQSCLLVWLHSSVPSADELFGPLPSLASLNVANQAPHRMELFKHYMRAIIRREDLVKYAERAFRLLDPNSPLLPFIEFMEFFTQYRFQQAAKSLDCCIERLDDKTNVHKLGENVVCEELIIELCDLVIKVRMATGYERREFLRLLTDSGLSHRFAQLFQRLVLMEHISDTEAQHTAATSADTEDYNPPSAETLVDELLKRKMFGIARTFSLANGLDVDIVAQREALELIMENFKRGTFETHEDRCTVLKQVDKLFAARDARPTNVARFFLHRADRFYHLLNSSSSSADSSLYHLALTLEPLPESMTILDAAQEHIVLLKHAKAWLELAAENAEDDSSDKPSLQMIEAQILRSSVLVQAETEAEKRATSGSRSRLLASASSAVNLIVNNLSGKSSQVLDSMVGALLNADNFAEAARILSELKFESVDFLIAQQMLTLAQSKHQMHEYTQATVPAALRKIFSTTKSWSATFDALLALARPIDTLELLDALCRCSRHARECCDRILVRYRVSRLMALAYDQLVAKDPYEVADELLMEGPDQLLLLKHFIQTANLDRDRVAVLMGQRCFCELMELDTGKLIPESSSQGISDTPYSPLSTPVKARASKSRLGNQTQASDASFAPRFWGSRHFNDYLDLTSDPALVGDELLSLWEGNPSQSSHVGEVELFIRALMSFRRAQDIQKQNRLFTIVKDRVSIYTKNKNFKLLVRLVTGTKQYSQLSYVLDILVKADCFEMLLSKNIYQASSTEGASGSEEEDRRELAISLYNFLKSNYPTHTEKMKLLFLRFTMYREYADILQERGWAALNAMKSRLDPSFLLQAMDLFLEAATNYAKEKAFVLERKCLDMARLIELQFELVDARVVNLKPDQALQFATVWPDFYHSHIVVCAYNLVSSMNDWVDILYHQVVTTGNFAFLEEFLANIEVEDFTDLLTKIAKKHKAAIVAGTIYGRTGTTITSNMKKLLEYMEDVHVRFRLSSDLGLSDVADGLLASVPGIEYFVQTPGTSPMWMQSNQDEVSLD